MANKNIVEAGRRTRFSSENQPKKSGRKPKLYRLIIRKEQSYKKK